MHYSLIEVVCLSVDRETRLKTSRIAVPSAGICGINLAIRALYAFKRPANYKELAQPVGISRVYMSMSLSSSRHVGLTKLTGQRGYYWLTELGEQYALFLTAGKEKKCRELLTQVILQNPWWTEIINFLRINQENERDVLDLVLDIEGKLGKKWSNRMRARVGSALTSILGYTEMVLIKGNKIIPQIGLTESKEEQEKKHKNIEDKKTSVGALNKESEKFAEFRIPDSFILYVRKEKNAIDFFKNQVNENSVFIPWLELIKKKMEETNNNKS